MLCFQTVSMTVHSRCESQTPQQAEHPVQPRRPSAPTQKKPQTTVILMRHGMTDWNQDGRVQGGLDKSRLNSTGTRQARQAGVYLRNVQVESVLCSPLRRARDTFQLIAEASANPDLLSRKVEILPALMEFQVPWQGSLRREIPNGPFQQLYSQFKKNPDRFSYNGFNPIRDVARRAQLVWDTVARTRASSCLIISHNQTNKALLCSALGMPTNLSSWNQGNCCFNVFIFEEGKLPRLRLCNGTDAPSPMTSTSRRARPRNRFARLVLFHQGSTAGLEFETAGTTVSRIYCFGHCSCDQFSALEVDDAQHSCTKIPLQEGESEDVLYQKCFAELDNIRRLHANEYVVICAENATIHSVLVAVSLGLGEEGLQRFHSDPGGVTIIDVDSSVEIGKGAPRVECYNVYAHLSHGPLLGYTCPLPT